MVKVDYVNYGDYGKCVEIKSDTQTMRITCELGPRIIYLAIDGKENIFYEDTLDLINKGGEFFDEHYGKDEMWHIYGGHRLWRSPEDLASYYPDNYPVEVELLDNGAIFTAKPESETTGLQKVIKVEVVNGEYVVEHKFINRGNATVDCSLWALSVLDKGGVAYYPYNQKDTVLLPNRNLVIWPYTDIRDKRITLLNEGIVLRQDPKSTSPLKLGFLNQTGEHYYVRGDVILSVTSEKAQPDGNYPDWSCSTETYTSENMLELETLSEIKTIAVGESATHVERWSLQDSNSDIYKSVKAKISVK